LLYHGRKSYSVSCYQSATGSLTQSQQAQLIKQKAINELQIIDDLIVFCQYLKMSDIGVFLLSAIDASIPNSFPISGIEWPAGEN
jgi:hypothetical protein